MTTVILKPDNARDRMAYAWKQACEQRLPEPPK